MCETELVRRPAGEPAPDLTDYRVVHRAMTVDLVRLRRAAAELVDRPDPARMAALRRHLRGVVSEIESHHQVEDDHVWPVLIALAGRQIALTSLTDDHGRLDPLLRRATELAARAQADPELVAVLAELAELLAQHVADEERDVFPLITALVRPADYRRLQRQFRANLRLRLLPFLLPWVFRHATTAERRVLLTHVGWPVRLLLMIVEPGYRAREGLLFG
jgi:iron-sulfur cluster repair protein YtfE (RIC family)